MPSQKPPQVTQGPIHKVPCPFCGQPMDFRAHADQESGGTGWGEQGLETGALVDCDRCGRTSKILAKEKITIIRLQPV
jgi:endogenous inhibitor of DNA gyrase (YacG/DUF329 family)